MKVIIKNLAIFVGVAILAGAEFPIASAIVGSFFTDGSVIARIDAGAAVVMVVYVIIGIACFISGIILNRKKGIKEA